MPSFDVSALKAGGIIAQVQPDVFSIRLRVPVGDMGADQLAKVAEVAKKYGNGHVHLTVRQGAEIPFVRFDDISAVRDELAEAGVELGACGPRVRVVTACPGSSFCRNALGDTQAFGKRLDQRYFGGETPHKVKLGVTGCPRSCSKPQENDIGFMAVAEPVLDESDDRTCTGCGLCARVCVAGAITMVGGKPQFDRDKCFKDADCVFACPTEALSIKARGWDIYVGGRWGRRPKLGTLFHEMAGEDEAFGLVGGIIEAYRRLANKRERLGLTIERTGIEVFKQEVYGAAV